MIDSFSRIVRLGEGISSTGHISEAAIERTIAALAICRDKIRVRKAGRLRLIATEACRAADAILIDGNTAAAEALLDQINVV